MVEFEKNANRMETLKQLLPVLEGFKVRVDENGKAVKCDCNRGQGIPCRSCCSTNQGFEVVRMPRMIDFVQYAHNNIGKCFDVESKDLTVDMWNSVVKYLRHAKQPPQLSDYIPCDPDGQPLAKPIECDRLDPDETNTCNTCGGACFATDYAILYQKALDRVIYEGWKVEHVATIIRESGKFPPIEYVLINKDDHKLYFDFCGNKIEYNYGAKDQYYISNREDAYIFIPHYIKLDKLK